jgi:ATP-dependent RNA helicase DeaD
LRVLVATDVAARGIDVQSVTRVVHGELPTNGDAYTHRAGRTGRAGRKGTSSLLVAPVGAVRASRLLRDLGVQHRFEPIPSAEEIVRAADAQLFEELTGEAEASSVEGEPVPIVDDARWHALAARLLEAGELERTLVRLLKRARRSVTEPRNVRVFPVRVQPERGEKARPERKRNERARPERKRIAELLRDEGAGRSERAERKRHGAESSPRESAERDERVRPERRRQDAELSRHESAESDERVRLKRAGHEAESWRDETAEREERAQQRKGDDSESLRHARPERTRRDEAGRPSSKKQKAKDAARAEKRAADALEFKSFHVSWGQRDGADARRLLAMVCRRGKIRGKDVGAIRVENSFSLIQVANAVAASFAKASSRPDPREPGIFIRPDRAQAAQGGDRPIRRR